MDIARPERLHVADSGRKIRPIFTLAAGSSRIPYARGLTFREICCGSIRAAPAAQAHFVASRARSMFWESSHPASQANWQPEDRPSRFAFLRAPVGRFILFLSPSAAAIVSRGCTSIAPEGKKEIHVH
jgi:hypothetical protein